MSEITLYPNPNVNVNFTFTISIFLAEVGAEYTVESDIEKIKNDERFQASGFPGFFTHRGFLISGTGPSLLYLQGLLDQENDYGYTSYGNPEEYSEIVQWLFAIHAVVAPIAQAEADNSNLGAQEKTPYAQKPHVDALMRLFATLDIFLTNHQYLVGEHYTIGDIAVYGCVRLARDLEIDMSEFDALTAWTQRIEARPAVQRVLAEMN
ncbi:hypothetical protein E1B28_000135 [Marasmius oreades]|uniref:GST C-terminal domain-containing protein n=1 Tax=Marasmius oreades TaxID=181124 RepID=A0A9P7V0U0_9AGAR|nr:uncharacterized protein E1B28_000135 [Marasmius oreades]KAG7098167.1 hypothetical protein E1B28_000135 [Marasmius oreades]